MNQPTNKKNKKESKQKNLERQNQWALKCRLQAE